MNRDIEFCNACQTGKEKAWASFFLEDGVMITEGTQENIMGRKNIEERMKKTFSLPQLHFTWKPTHCEISDDQTLAVTRGTSVIKYERDGELVTHNGNYTSIWKYVDGNWYISWDIGN